jgi:hypothetical protein
VAPGQLRVAGRLGRQAGLGADRAQQVDARSEAARRQRMARPEVVGRGPWAVDEEHGGHPTGASLSEYHPRMPVDLIFVLVIILIVVLIWRGPKTLPKIGEALGRGVREAKSEASNVQKEIQSRTDGSPNDDAGRGS